MNKIKIILRNDKYQQIFIISLLIFYGIYLVVDESGILR